MTKLKNTKKGMAKKALSISLVAAMLATSNVPVWAAEDLFTDGSDVAVEVEATDEVDMFTEAPADEIAPTTEGDAFAAEVEENEFAAVLAANDADDVNVANYTVNDLAIGTVSGWDTAVSVSGSIKDGGTEVDDLEYVWLADGYQASGSSAIGSNAAISSITYTPTINDFGKTLSLRLYKVGVNGAVIFSKTISGGVVQAKDISNDFDATLTLTGVTGGQISYNGDERKPLPDTAYSVDITDRNNATQTLDGTFLDWHYETSGNDFTNVTEKDITVYGTLVGTNDPSSPAYGYTAKTEEATYQIAPFEVDADNLVPSVVTTSVQYTGSVHTFGKNDVKLEVAVSDTKKVDITAALAGDAEFVGADNAVGTGYKLPATTDWEQFDDSDAAKAILKNFDVSTNSLMTETKNTYNITKRNLNECTGVITAEYSISAFKGDAGKNATIDPADIKLTGKDGKSFTLQQMVSDGDAVIIINNAVFAAANADRKGVVQNAVTVNFGRDSENVTGKIELPLTLVIRSLGTVTVNNGTADITMPTTKSDAGDIIVPYTGKAYSLTGTSGALKDLKVSGAETSEYSVSYNDNVNAGIVEVTITGKESLAGSTKKVYFTIEKAPVSASGFSVKNGVTVNPANNNNASLYKDALGTKFETTLAGTKTTLKDGTDYTVKYYYVDSSAPENIISLADVKANAGTNIPGNYIFAVATLAKNGNYDTTDTFIADYAVIEKKSISNVKISVEKESYTFTGKEIVPEIVVKDGSITLEKGVDYTLKLNDNINVGTATITVVPKNGSDYDTSTTATATFKIEAAKAEDVKVTLAGTQSANPSGTANTFDYTGRQVKPSVSAVTLNGVDVSKYFDITYVTYGENVNAGKEMGSVSIAPKADTKNFTGTKTHLFNIKGKELAGSLKAYYSDKTEIRVDTDKFALNKNGDDYSFYYDGGAQTFADELFTPNALINAKEGTDYEIKYINNTDAGIAFVAAVAKGNYEANDLDVTALTWGDYSVVDGKLMKNNTVIENNIVDIIAFRIQPTIFTARNITVANGTYAGGMPVKPQVAVVVNGKTLIEGEDYKLAVSAIDGKTTPDKFVNVTTDKPYYVTVIPMGGYGFDNVNGTNTYVWGIDKKDLKDCFVSVTRNEDEFNLVVMNGNVTETKESFDVADNGDGTATVSVVDDGKNYTGSTTVTIIDPSEQGAVGVATISDVKIIGNTATVVLSGEAENAAGYDFVIATENDYKNGRVSINKNQLKTSTDFRYVQRGVYYAYCHAYKRDENGKKVFGDWSNLFRFEVSSVTPDQPVITKVAVTGSTVKVTYTKSENAVGYDIILGKSAKKVNGEKRPVDYGKLVKKVTNGNTVTATFKNVPGGTYYAGLHAYNRTRVDNKKVFSTWSNVKTVKVK